MRDIKYANKLMSCLVLIKLKRCGHSIVWYQIGLCWIGFRIGYLFFSFHPSHYRTPILLGWVWASESGQFRAAGADFQAALFRGAI